MDRASLARQIKIHVEDSTDTLLKQLKFERRRNDSLERENAHMREVEYLKFFIVQIAATFVALMVLYVVVNL